MMKRLTSDNTDYIFYDLNLFFAKDNEIWIRGGGPEPDYQDCTLVNWIGRVADKHNLEIYARDAVNLGDEMYDCLQYGIDTIEGVVALLHTAAVQATTMRSRLKEIEDILGDDYGLDRLKELVQADREGKVILRHIKEGGEVYIILLGRIFLFDVISATLYGENIVYEAEHGMCLKYRFDNTDIGTSVFLTKEEAEAAMERMKNRNEA